MSNQPKITYRSDSTGCTYQMMQHGGSFTIQAVNLDGVCVDESPRYAYVVDGWRKSIDLFFDVITVHINHSKWEV